MTRWPDGQMAGWIEEVDPAARMIENLGLKDGVLIVDETGFLKKGEKFVA